MFGEEFAVDLAEDRSLANVDIRGEFVRDVFDASDLDASELERRPD